MTKRCRICKIDKSLDQFHRRKAAKDGHHSACKPCAIAEQNRSKAKVNGIIHINGTKRCATCRELKPVAAFVRNKNYGDGLNHVCKTCLYPQRKSWGESPEGKKVDLAGRKRRYHADPDTARNDRVRRAHGVPADTFAKLLEIQGGGCAICGREKSVSGRRLSIDHCHMTLAVRGLLCTWCNQAIGQLQESPELFAKALAYLENPPAAHLGLTSVFVRKPDR